jgi:mannose-1-phosphate guanylyltransferase/mannose-6-phosphate isomerase
MTKQTNKSPVVPVKLRPVILCGGSGTRLWPLSRSNFPKQFLALFGDKSLFQRSVQRLSGLGSSTVEVQAPLILGNEEHRFLILDQMRELETEPESLLLEPVGRNTAPALTLAALAALEAGDDPVLVVSPADHIIADLPAFSDALAQAVNAASRGAIAILGITPDSPHTGYGYVRTRAAGGIHAVEQFVEKPDLATAQKYLDEGAYYWNAGLFVLKASVWMAAIEQTRPDIAKATRTAWLARTTDAKFVRPGRDEFERIPADSIDYAVMEKLSKGSIDMCLVPFAGGWSDVGAWEAVWQVAPKDELGNTLTGDVLHSDCKDILVHSTSRLVSVVGLSNVAVIETADAVLVTSKAHSQDVKNIVADLASRGREEHALHRKVHRPWGWYDSVDEGGQFKVKRIQVKPGASLSLQLHHHRSEHWIVVSGVAEVTNGDRTFQVQENQSTYIPQGVAHRLRNPGTAPLEIIEVQTGSYLGEDDIVRLEDNYGRA